MNIFSRLTTTGVLLAATLLATSAAQAAISKWVDIRIDNGILWLETEVAGVPGYSMIDSGAQVNAINSQFLSASGQTYETGRGITIIGVHGRDKRRTYLSVPVGLFGSDLELTDIVDLNFGGDDEQLILGGPFLEQFIFQFDYPNNRMRIITRDSINLKKLKNVKSKRDNKSSDPIVKVRLNDEKNVWLLLDTGSSGGVLIDRSVANRQNWLDTYPTTLESSRGATTTGQTEEFKLPTLNIGGFELGNVSVNVPAKGQDMELFKKASKTGSHLTSGRTQSVGIIGHDVLKHFIVTVDYKGGHVHLEAPAPEGSSESDK